MLFTLYAFFKASYLCILYFLIFILLIEMKIDLISYSFGRFKCEGFFCYA